MKTIRLLILEDDLETLSILLDRLYKLEEKLAPQMIAVTILSEYTQVKDYINRSDNIHFNVILLDRDCKAGGSFHVLDLKKFDVDRIIGISSTPPYNQLLVNAGVTKIVQKENEHLEAFADNVIALVEKNIFEQN